MNINQSTDKNLLQPIMKWVNMTVVLLLFATATTMLYIGNVCNEYQSINKVICTLSIPVYIASYAIGISMYNEKLLPDVIQDFIKNILKED